MSGNSVVEFTEEEVAKLMTLDSRIMVFPHWCDICDEKNKPGEVEIETMSYLTHVVHRSICYCKKTCEDKAKLVFLNALKKDKLVPTQFKFPTDPKQDLVIARTDGTISKGQIFEGLRLGWSVTAKEPIIWVTIKGTRDVKPLLLSLFLEKNPQFRTFLKIEFEHSDIFEKYFPEYHAEIITAVQKINDRFFPNNE